MAAAYPQIAALLERARKGLGLSQEEAAHRIGVSLTTYGRWERGQRRPHKRHAELAAEVLEVDVEELLEGAELEARAVPPSLQDVVHELLEASQSMVRMTLEAREANERQLEDLVARLDSLEGLVRQLVADAPAPAPGGAVARDLLDGGPSPQGQQPE